MDLSSLVFVVIGLVIGFLIATKIKSMPRPQLGPDERKAIDAKAVSLDFDPDVVAQLPFMKIEAIKIYRKKTGKGLKESKDTVDAMIKQLGL